MARYAAELSYDGALFSGWQRQPNQTTVQQVLEDVLSKLNGSSVAVAGAGRTDTGVHARAQMCSFDMSADWDNYRLLRALNAHLPQGISVLRTARTRPDFHARFDALKREYIYFIWTGRAIYPHLVPVTSWVKGSRFDWERASKACSFLEGEHDFSNFCRVANIPADPVRRLYKVRLHRRGGLVWVRFIGSGFLTNMVRMIMGSLILIAKGEREPEWIKTFFMPGFDRNSSGKAFSPCGLFLWRIEYEESPWI